MNHHKLKENIQSLINPAGIKINGSDPCDIKVQNDDLYERVIKNGALGLGEAYMGGWWDCDQLDEFVYRIIAAGLEHSVKSNYKILLKIIIIQLFNPQTIKRSKKVAKQHYDLGNDLYNKMLGRTMSYTCGYFNNTDSLDEAQDKKHDLICRKIGLKPGDKVLELGCGFGSFAYYAASHYGANITAVNISTEQIKYAQQLCGSLPVKIIQADYRNQSLYNPSNQQFDHVVSIGLCEHVGHKNYRKLMQIAENQLKDEGFFLLHTIGANRTWLKTNAWITKYIFPNGMIPSIEQLGAAMGNLFVMEDWHNFGGDYEKTLKSWHANFINSWSEISDKYGERFFRMWNYYLLSCAGSFRARNMQLWQLVLSKKGISGKYRIIR